MQFVQDDGGRSKYFKGDADDCVARAISIAGGIDYREVYDRLAAGNSSQRGGGKKSARHGILVKRKWFKDYMAELGFVWTPTMKVGSGCTTHLRTDELPAKGKLVCSLSRHYAAVIDGVIHDTDDPSRGGTRCVYGYWTLKEDE